MQFSRREWWRLVHAANLAGISVEEFVCECVLDKLDKLDAPWAYPPRSKNPRSGYVYAMARRGLTKLGLSVDPEVRSRAVGAALLFKLWTADMRWAESFLHDRFEAFQVHGEWYRLTRAHLDEILSLAKTIEKPPAPLPLLEER